VAASFNTPTLFQIANDLTQMQVLADIDEADVGQLTTDSKVTFTVDAFPSDSFEGRIAQIRLAPQVVQNVTTYTAVINVANKDGKLRPGMTANVTATTAHREDVLTVPNAALRFRPAQTQKQQGTGEHAARKGNGGGSTVWRLAADQNTLEPVRLTLGITNGTVSEVTGGGLNEGDVVVLAARTDADASKKGQTATGSPFGMGGTRRPAGAAAGGRR
jgi:HlyD family secretion protein